MKSCMRAKKWKENPDIDTSLYGLLTKEQGGLAEKGQKMFYPIK